MFDVVVFSATFLVSCAYTLWVYWGVPVRSLAFGAFIGGSILALVQLAVLGTSRHLFAGFIDSRVLASFALGCGVGLGGLLATFMYLMKIPSRSHGA